MDFTTWIITILSLAIGYGIGRRYEKQELKSRIQSIAKEVRKYTTKVGPVNRPSAEAVMRRQDPKKLEEEIAMSDSLKRDIGDPNERRNS